MFNDLEERKRFLLGDRYVPPRQTTQTQVQPAQRKGFQPSALISEGGGLGGALAGGAAGAAIGSVVPVLGTALGGLIGAGLGGFLGGTGGSAVEQKVRDNKVDLGKALKEGAVEGVLSAGPWRLGKAAIAGGKALRSGGSLLPSAPIQQVAKNIPVKDISSTSVGSVGARIPTTPSVGKNIEPLDDFGFITRFQKNANEALKTTPGVFRTASSSTRDPLNLVINHLAANATKGEIRSIVNSLFPQSLNNTTRNRLVKDLLETKDPNSVKQLISLTEQGLRSTPTGSISPNELGVRFGQESQKISILPGPQQAVQASNGLPSVIESINDSLSRPGVISRAGASLRGGARGVDVGAKVAGTRIGPEQVGNVNNFLEKTVKIGRGSAAKQLEKLEPFIKNQSDSLSQAITKSNRPLTDADKKSILDAFQNNFSSSIIGPTTRQQGIADDLLTRVNQATDIRSLDDLRKIVDDNINFARNAASPEPAAEQVYKAFRRILTDDVANKVGAAKSLKTNLANAFEAQDLLLNKAAKPSGTSIAGTNVPGRVGQSLQSNSGSLVGGIGRALESRGPLATGARVVAGSSIANASSPQQSKPAGLEEALMQSQDPVLSGDLMGLDSQMLGMGTQEQSPYSREALQYDIQRDPENADNYLAYYQQLQEVYAIPEEKPLSAEASKTVGTANSGLSSLAQLESIQNQGGVPLGTTVPGRGLFGGLGQSLLGTTEFDAVADNVADAMVRLRTGAAATKEELALYRRLLPQAFDSPEDAALKIAQVRDYFNSISSRTGVAGNDLQAALGY